MPVTLQNRLQQTPGEFGLNADCRLSIELRSPWRASRLSRPLYYIYEGDNIRPSLIVKDADPLYAPAPAAEAPVFHSRFMPRGGFFAIDGKNYEWSEFVDGRSLREILGKNRASRRKKHLLRRLLDKLSSSPKPSAVHENSNLLDFARLFLEEQKKEALVAPMPLSELVQKTLPLLRQDRDKEYFLTTADLLTGSGSQSLLCSHAHGDLWPMDVLARNGEYVVLDWEWAAARAPLGSDLIDLALCVCTMHEGLSFENAWQSALDAQKPLFRLVRDCLQAKNCQDSWLPLLSYCLLRSLGRELAQDGFSADLAGNYKSVAELLTEGCQHFKGPAQ